jgi:hypothetical protein
VKGAVGFNENAIDRFLQYDSRSPVGSPTDGWDVLGPEAGLFFGGRGEILGREVRYKGVFNWELNYETAEGWRESREPRRADIFLEGTTLENVTRSGDLAFGELSLSEGRFDLTTSEQSEQTTYYGGLGFDLDEGGNHRLDLTGFYTKKDQEVAQLFENGFLPNFDYASLDPEDVNPDDFLCCAPDGTFIVDVRNNPGEARSRGPIYFASFLDSRSFGRERDLLVAQLNGDHRGLFLDGLQLAWAANYATTTQTDDQKSLQYFFEPDCASRVPLAPDCVPSAFPATPGGLGAGFFYANGGRGQSLLNEVEERQYFGRVDGEYEVDVSEAIAVKLASGGWYENAQRDVDSQGFPLPSGQIVLRGGSAQDLGTLYFGGGFGAELRPVTNDSTREIWAWSLGPKATFWNRFDLLGGLRFENITIESNNDPRTGRVDATGVDAIRPSRYLFFDRRDNPTRAAETPTAPAFTVFNDQILGITVPIDRDTTLCDATDPQTGAIDRRGCVDITNEQQEALINGRIDEQKLLPSLGFAVRPLEGLALRGAWSQTVARPSFREMGYYLSFEPGSSDAVIGNPQLQLSEVESYDLRGEYVWGDGDLFALSGFYKTIEKPIESIILRDPSDFTRDATQYRTFFNNPNEGTLWGIEVEGRKNLGFVPRVDLFEFFSVGGNFTWIDASVDRSDLELRRVEPWFRTCSTTDPICERSGDGASFGGLAGSRRLFGQPEWIANADLTFEQPDWGSKATLAFFAISDVLDAAGGATFISAALSGNPVRNITLDRYVDSFHQLDLILSQSWSPRFMRGEWTFKLQLKNLTDSTRQLIYDPEATREEVAERSFKVGREFKFSVTYGF